MSSIKQTNIQQYVEKDYPLHLDEVYTCELGLGGGFAPKPGAAEQYKVAHFGYRMRIGLPNSLLLFFSMILFFAGCPWNISQTLNQEFGGLGRAGVCSRGMLEPS